MRLIADEMKTVHGVVGEDVIFPEVWMINFRIWWQDDAASLGEWIESKIAEFCSHKFFVSGRRVMFLNKDDALMVYLKYKG